MQTKQINSATNAKFTRAWAWAMLMFAIALEICGLSILKALDNAGHGTAGKVALVVLMNISYFLMSLTLRQIAVGVAYATWEIVGGIGVLLVSFVFFDPHLSTAQYFGIALGFSGIVCIILGEEHGESHDLGADLRKDSRVDSRKDSQIDSANVCDSNAKLRESTADSRDSNTK